MAEEPAYKIEGEWVPGVVGSSVPLADTLPQIVWTADASGRVTYFNRRWYEYTGLDEEGSLGFAFVQALHPGDEERTIARWERAWRLGERYEIEYRLHARSLGAYRWFLARANPVRDASGRIVQWSGTCTDIDDQKRFEEEARRHAAELKASRAELAHLVRHDVLTGLPNRLLFTDRLERALATAERHGRLLAVFFVDLDGFKRINDTLGHDAGDELLKEIARRLTSVVRSSDTVARLGGDEFVVLVPELERPEDAMALARKLLRHAGAPYDLGDQRVRVTASLGVSVYPDDADEASTLLRHADVAMYRAKQSGKNDARFFAPEMNATAHERMRIATHLDGALERGELRLEYQPQWDAVTSRPVAFEALLRWTSPTLGDVPPERFVPVAEDNGAIVEICAWVIDQSCQRAVQWSHVLGGHVRVAANVSLVQLDREDFVPMVADALTRHGLDPQLLELELTARIGGHDLELVRTQLEQLACLGVRLTMDDFGTPGSSIDHVMRLPLHALKIDQHVARDVGAGTSEERVLAALVSLAQALDLDVVASGIETEAQRRQALSLGCDRLQGFLLSGPLTEREADAYVAAITPTVVEGG